MGKWQYGIVIDAGSSGSRVHVYRWLHSERALRDADPRQLESLPVLKTQHDWTKKIKPGISTFADDPDRVGPEHLKLLLDHALDIIPEDAVAKTPIFLLATAGMRLLQPEGRRRALLDEICAYVRASTSLLLTNCDFHIQVIPGETEGLYGWIAVNYLLGGFDAPREHNHGKGHHTYGFLDMGGASAQIAFAPNATESEKHADDLKLLRLRNINGAATEYRVFVTTWLEFGVNRARRRYVETLLDRYGSATGGHRELPDPCLPTGLRVSAEADAVLSDRFDVSKSVTLIGTGKFDECLRSTLPLLNKDAPCADPPCLLNGIHVPAIDFDVNHFVGVSEYWHTTHEVFEMAHRDKAYDFHTYQDRVRSFCSSDWTEVRAGIGVQKWGKKVTEATAVQVCFKASWLISVMHDGIGIPRIGIEELKGDHNGTKEVLDSVRDMAFTDPFQAVNKIHGTEVSWTLGRMVLYAASEIKSHKMSPMPVGFGSNVARPHEIAKDFQYAGMYHLPTPNATNHDEGFDGDSWRDTLFEGKTPRRVPGFLLFLFIIFIALFLLCGKDRRGRFVHRLKTRFLGGSGRLLGRPFRHHKPVYSPSMAQHGATERLFEHGLLDPDDFELGRVEGAYADEEDICSDDSSSRGKRQHPGRISGRATPSLRASGSKVDVVSAGGSSSDVASQVGGSGLGISRVGSAVGIGNAMDRSGLFVRTESRERLTGLGLAFGGADERRSRSRRGSPTRYKSPLMGSLAED